jgi:hypothetical protein
MSVAGFCALYTVARNSRKTLAVPGRSWVGRGLNPQLNTFPAVILAIQTVPGRRYRIETSQDMTTWSDTGVSFIGDGTEMSCAIERSQTKAFFRGAVD